MKVQQTLNLGETATALLQQEQDLRPTSFLLHVQVPEQAIHYIPYACNYQGFVVQRRYQGVGHPYYTEHESSALVEQFCEYAPYWQPYLNPLAVAHAGLDMATILEWAAAHPEAIFRHPTYAPLCLRWKSNTHGVILQVPTDEDYLPEAVYFTPHTCQLTDTTYYQYIASQSHDEELIQAMKSRAGLICHERELGAEGDWEGLYSTDLIYLETLLTTQGYQFKLAQAQVVHFVAARPTKAEIDTLAYYDLREQALAHFARFSVCAALSKVATYPMGQIGWVELLGGKVMHEQITARKPLDWEHYTVIKEWCAAGAGEQAATSGLPLPFLPCRGAPLARFIPTLRSLLAAAGCSRHILAPELPYADGASAQQEKHPLEMSLMEIQLLAILLKIDFATLAAIVCNEITIRLRMKELNNTSQPTGYS